MLEKLTSVNQTNLKWALVALGIGSFVVNGTVRVVFNVAIALVAVWILIILQRQSPKSREQEKARLKEEED